VSASIKYISLNIKILFDSWLLIYESVLFKYPVTLTFTQGEKEIVGQHYQY